MASPAQILANRDNAQHSTGPKTEAGKQSSSRNATRHGLTGSQIVIAGEDPAAYEDLRQGLHESYKPANDPEHLLVEQIAAGFWRLQRAHRIEAAVFNKLVEDSDNPEAALANAFIERPADLARIQRYVTAAHNAYYKALRELEKLQQKRRKDEEEMAMATMHSMMQSRLAPPIGFVSQSGPQPVATPENGAIRNSEPRQNEKVGARR
jgi:hypothetical protein